MDTAPASRRPSHAFLALTRVEPGGAPSTTRRRLDVDAEIVDDASGASLAALELRVRGAPMEETDSGVPSFDAGTAPPAASYVFRVE